ncbi:MAG TPA: nucleoside triphosphate pyrophosphohydrolase [Gammaproteobacteria bacterium]|nr:nucleoside triphosphate pyrophosphohydrolase [Gammaproteobacteria bacterium]
MDKQSDKRDIAKLLEIMAKLRGEPGGCPWDREQTFATIAPYTVEEAYEVADAIERGALEDLEGELGDLLFQVVFHARMAEEAGAFDFGDVVEGICAKLVRRHPHVFGELRGLDAAAQTRLWEDIKREERGAAGARGVLDGVAAGLPGLSRAAKLGKRAAAVAFDWPDVAGVRAKVDEELAELDAALAEAAPGKDGAGAPVDGAVEIGDLFFTLANLCRHLGLDPEACVRGANARFEKRFRHVEAKVRAAGGAWQAHDAAALDRWWREAKTRT